MLKLNSKKYSVCALLAILLLSVAASSSVHARGEDLLSPAASDEDEKPSSDTQNLIMTLNDDITTQDNLSDEPNLYQTQDDSSAVDDNSTLVIAQDDVEGSQQEDNYLIAAHNAPDLGAPIVGIAALLAAVAAIVGVMHIRKRKAD